ncbi:MAG: hypothetical protein Q4P72_04760, partial [Eubacteriales bacterium]|nr:hypothetical protein [Eubacteriales bacterium]
MRKARRLIALLLPVFMILGSWMQTVGASEAGGANGLLYTFKLNIAPIMDDFDTLLVHVRDDTVHETITLTREQPVATRRCLHVPAISYDNPEVLDDVTVYFVGDSQGQELRFNVSRIANAAPRLQWFTNTPSDYKEKYISFEYRHFIQTQTGYFEPNMEKTVTILPEGGYYLPEEYYSGFEPGKDKQNTVNREYFNISEPDQFDAVSVGFKTTGPTKETLDGDKIKIIGDKWYFYDITGSSRREGFQFNLREIQKVAFNSGAGKFGEAGPNAITPEYEIGHSETLSKRGISAPSDIKAPEGKKLIGWKADNKGEVISPEDLLTLPITASTVFYAVYDKDDSQFINITANTNDPANSVVLAEENPIEVAVKSTWADIKSVKTASGKTITDLVTPNPGYAIYQWLREEAPGTFVPLTDATVFEDSADVIADVKKVVLDEEPTKPEDKEAYVKVSFKSDAAEATENGGYFGTAEEKHEEINKWVLKNSPRSVLAQPTPVANVGFTFNAWDPAEYPTTEFTTDETYTATWTKLADIIGPVDPTDPKKPEKPEGYVTVSFLKGANGTLSTIEKTGLATVEYYVNPTAKKTMADVAAPTIVPETGYSVAAPAWKDAAEAALDTATAIDKDLSYTAQYKKLADVIGPVDPTDPEKPKKPEGYVTVSFLKGANGTLSTTEKTGLATVEYYVNPEAKKTLADV